MIRRCAGAIVVVGVLIAWAAPAGAHVTIQPGEATQGGFATEFFQVPNERDDAQTTMVEVTFPADNPIPYVSVQPVPGWTVKVDKTTLDKPIDAEGTEITEAVSKITWSGGAIEAGQFERFPVSMGPLPEVAALEFKAVQTYSNGEVVRWIDATPASGEEPEHPAPVLTLTKDTSETAAPVKAAAAATTSEAVTTAQDDADNAKTIAYIGIAIGAVGLIVAIVALVRRRSSTT